MKAQGWTDGRTESCSQFQLDLSCLVDGELEEAATGRAINHLESCPECTRFFEDIRLQVRLHLDLAKPERLLQRFADFTGVRLEDEVESLRLVDRLVAIFYRLGKAYLLCALDTDFRTRIFERVVPVGSEKTRGRGFVDGVLSKGQDDAGGVDWQHARHMLNGKLEAIEDSKEKGERLLEEALRIDPAHEEARLYLAYLHFREGKRVRAAREYRQIFRTAKREANRGHAAIQLGCIHEEEGDFRRALACFRWVTISGLVEREEQFWFVHFNAGMFFALLRDRDRSLASFRKLLDRWPERSREISSMFARSPRLRASIDSQAGFAEALLQRCPELFCDQAT